MLQNHHVSKVWYLCEWLNSWLLGWWIDNKGHCISPTQTNALRIIHRENPKKNYLMHFSIKFEAPSKWIAFNDPSAILQKNGLQPWNLTNRYPQKLCHILWSRRWYTFSKAHDPDLSLVCYFFGAEKIMGIIVNNGKSRNLYQNQPPGTAVDFRWFSDPKEKPPAAWSSGPKFGDKKIEVPLLGCARNLVNG